MREDIQVSLTPLTDIDALGRRWEALQSRCAGSYFTTWGWVGCWLRALPPAARPQVLQARQDGELVGLALIGARRRVRRKLISSRSLFLNETGDPHFDQLTVEHNGILAPPTLAAAVTRAAAARLLSRGGWDELVLRRLDTLVGLEPVREARKTVLIEELRAPSHFVDLRALREAGTPYLAAVSGNTRYQIKRTLKEYAKHGPLSVAPAQTVEQALEYLARLKDLHQAYWVRKGEPGAFANDFFDRFHRMLVAARFTRGEIQLLRVGTQGEAIGYLYNFVHDGVVCNYQSGFRYDQGPQLKPGIASHYLAIEHNLQNNAVRYDFLAGDYQYKKSLGTHAGEMIWAIVRRERLRFQAEDALRRVKRRILPAARARWQALTRRWRAAR